MLQFWAGLAALTMALTGPARDSEDAPMACTTEDRLPLGRSWLAKANRPDAVIKPGKLYVTASEGSPAAYGFTARKAGRYRIASDRKVWIELSQSGAALASASHQRAAACSGIHKIVDFNLQPGQYSLSFKETDNAAIKFIIIRAP
jgi:hypothetical protein